MQQSVSSIAAGLVVLSLVFWPIERRWPALVRPSRWRSELGTDVLYWFFSPLVTRLLTRVGVALAVLLLVMASGAAPSRDALVSFLGARDTWAQRQPLAFQVLEMLLIGDLVGYGMHRLFHGRRLFRFHAVHHSSKELDWLSSARLHPVNGLLSRIPPVVVLLLLGFSPALLAGYVPFLSFYALLLHAKVSWDFGPLRHVVASPHFHRWHHTSRAEGRDKNFAGLFPFIDGLFGTLYLPAEEPHRFGVEGEAVPPGIVRQLAYPFR